jgi:MFS family permease
MNEVTGLSDWKSLKSVYNSAFFCSLGFFFVGFILPIIAYGYLEASAVEVAFIFALLTLGTAIFSPIAGKIVKAGQRRSAIAAGALARAFSYIGMAFGVWLGSIALLTLNSLIWGMGAAFYWVGSDAEISERVYHHNRSEAFGRREAMTSRGSVIGAFVGFSLLMLVDLSAPFLFFSVMNAIGGFIVLGKYPPFRSEASTATPLKMGNILAFGIAALVIAAAIDAFGMSLLSPFVELLIIYRMDTGFSYDSIATVALIYLPPGIVSSVLSGYVGRYADKANKVTLVAAASLVGSITNIMLVIAPNLWWIAIIFMIQNVVGIAGYFVLASVFGTAYEGHAEEGFGWFSGILGLARFSGPIIGGLLWEGIDPTAPFILIAMMELLLVPIYYLGMQRYQNLLIQKGIVNPEESDS